MLEAYKLNSVIEQFDKTESVLNIKGSSGNNLSMVSWLPPKMKFLVVLIHGLGEHMLRYRNWAGLFYQNSIGVIGIDLRGHGKSAGQLGNGTISEFTGDIDILFNYVHKNYPFVPKILYGHSMGGNLALRYVIDYKPNILGIIATSPWLKLYNPPQGIVLKAGKLLRSILPRMPLSNGLDTTFISRNAEEVKLYQNDPLVHARVTPRLFFSIFDSGLFILQNKQKINLPLLIMHGSGDQITSHKASSEFANYTSSKTSLKIWKGAYHELHHEFEREEIFSYILGWIESIYSTK